MQRETRPILCYVTDRRAIAHGDLLGVIRAAITGGVDWIQIREKDLPTRPLRDLVREAVRAAGTRTKIIVNDRLDVALAAGAAGVHLGGESLPVAEVKRWCHERAAANFLVGASCHSLAEAREAARDPADYVIFGPVFATPSKLQYGPPQGLERLAEICSALRIPVLAIGGITPENAAECVRAGAAGLAAIRLFQESTDLPATVAKLRAALEP